MLFVGIPTHLPPGELPNPIFTHLQLTRLGTPPPNDYRAVIVAAYYDVTLRQSGDLHAFYNRQHIQIIESSLVLNSTANSYTLRITYSTVATSASPGIPFPQHIYAQLPHPQPNPLNPNRPNPPANPPARQQ